MEKRTYMCIDLKSFYASVECVERGLDPMHENLIVADPERSDKTICLAITPAMKALGIKNRCRVFEIPKNVEYIIAEPRMQLYIDYAARIYEIYLSYIAKEDIHVYSIDEVFMDVTNYLPLYKMTPKELCKKIMGDVLEKIGVRATCGIGTNLYLSKIALDITAKHAEDFIGYLDEEMYKKTLWNHKPITDFWRIGPGTAKRLEKYGITTMGEVAKADEDLLYKIFGIDAELLIDHANGIEPVTISDIKNYRAKTNCLTSGQVLMCDYSFDDAKMIVREMTEALCLELMDKGFVCESVTLTVGYSNTLKKAAAHGTTSFGKGTNLSSYITANVLALYEKIMDKTLPIRRINICFNRVTEECMKQLSFLDDTEHDEKNEQIQKTMIKIKKQFGKNSVLKGTSLYEKATGRERNRQIGGHKSGEK